MTPLSTEQMPTILIVEDTDWIRSGMKQAAQQCGYIVAEAKDDREAVAIARNSRPDLILTDEHLPGFRTLVERIHADPALQDLPVVIIDPDAQEGSRVGEAFVVKDYEAIAPLLAQGSRKH
jgi:CheY-like chemotaxis protein